MPDTSRGKTAPTHTQRSPLQLARAFEERGPFGVERIAARIRTSVDEGLAVALAPPAIAKAA